MDDSRIIGACAIGVHGARLLCDEPAYARVLLLGDRTYIAKSIEFLEQTLCADVLGRGHNVADPL